MTYHLSLRVRRATAITGATLALVAMAIGPSRAQSSAWTSPYPLILTPTRALALVEAANQGLDYVPGEVVIKFKDGVSATGQQRALAALRTRPAASELRWNGTVAVWSDPAERDARVLAAQLATQPEVAYAEPNFLFRHKLTPNDPSFSARQWNMSAIDMPRAWDINPGATDKTIVAVIDTGITTVNRNIEFPTWDGRRTRTIAVPFAVNPDLSGARLLEGKDFAFWDGPVLDMQGHGTHVASTIGEEANNNLAAAGIAYQASILPVKVCFGFWEIQFALSAIGTEDFAPEGFEGCDTVAMAEGIRYAVDNGARILNISLGGFRESITVREALTYAVQKGAFIAIAMGNEFEEGNPTSYPAANAKAIDGAMAVAAVGRSLKRAYYSNTGPHTEISAPGGDGRDGGGSGLVWQSTIDDEDFTPLEVLFPRFDRYALVAFQGTSMASPHVAGVAALIMSQGITKPAAIEAVIKGTAKDLGSPGRDDDFGEGLIQPRAALFGNGVAK